MTMSKRRRFSSKEKISIIKQHLLENKKISDICEKNNLQPTVFYRWQKVFFENAENIFQVNDSKENKKFEKKIALLEQKLVQKNEVISELLEEHVALKKKFGEN